MTPEEQKKANVKTALILLTVVLCFSSASWQDDLDGQVTGTS